MYTVFANGFSERLNIEASKHRPPSLDLSYEQIAILSGLAGYHIHKINEKKFTIFHSDREHGLDAGLYLIWHVRTDGWNLIYYPTLRFVYLRGPKSEIIDMMLDHLASFLPNLGYQKEIVVPLNEEVVTLPNELAKGSDGILVMFLSEFQNKYQPLYRFFQEKMVTPR